MFLVLRLKYGNVGLSSKEVCKLCVSRWVPFGEALLFWYKGLHRNYKIAVRQCEERVRCGEIVGRAPLTLAKKTYFQC